MRVLVVDDDPGLRLAVRHGLQAEGFEVLECADAEAALRAAAESRVDIALLDLHLPGRSGLELLSLLRERHSDLHVIVLTGAGSEAERVLGLVSGADDYMVKPFSMRELLARVIAVRRRHVARQPPQVIDAGSGMRIDLAARAVTIDGEPVDLTRLELDLLIHLATHPNQAFSRGELLRAVWSSSVAWQSATTVTEHVGRLRRKIERDPKVPARIVTVRGSGYRFEQAPGAEQTSPAEPAP